MVRVTANIYIFFLALICVFHLKKTTLENNGIVRSLSLF